MKLVMLHRSSFSHSAWVVVTMLEPDVKDFFLYFLY